MGKGDGEGAWGGGIIISIIIITIIIIIIIIIIIPKRTAPRRVLSLGSLGRAAPSRPVARWARGRQPLRIVMINMFTMPYGLPYELPIGLPYGLPYRLPDGFLGMTTLYD